MDMNRIQFPSEFAPVAWNDSHTKTMEKSIIFLHFKSLHIRLRLRLDSSLTTDSIEY